MRGTQRRWMSLAAVVAFLGLLASALGQMRPASQKGECQLTGVVVGDDRTPMPGVRVKLDRVPPPNEARSGVPADRPADSPPDELPPPPARPLGFLPAPGSAPNELNTDDSGRFLFERLAAGRYRLSVVAPNGYVLADRTFNLNLSPGESRSVVLRLERAGAITGRLLASGKGFGNASVRVLQWGGPAGGPRRLVSVFSGTAALSATTGPNGEFGFFDLPPGDYFLVGAYHERLFFKDIRSRPGFVPTYYPGTTMLGEARPVTVRAGETIDRVEFAIQPGKRSTISVTAVDSRGRRLPGGLFGHVGLRPASDTRPPSLNTVTVSTGPSGSADGKFELRDVAAGDYYLDASLYNEQNPGNGQPARIRTADGRSLWEAESAYLPVTVKEGENLKVEIRTNAGAAVSGRVVLEGASEASNRPGVGIATVTARAAGYVQFAMPPAAAVRADGTFTLTGLHGTVVLTTQARGVIKSVTVAGRDVTGKPFDLKGDERLTDVVITLTTEMATIQGVVDAGDAGAVFVVAFPDDAARCLPGTVWLRMLRLDALNRPPAAAPGAAAQRSAPTSSGPISFALRELLPGRYLVAAIAARGQSPVFDAAMLEKLRPLATQVELQGGETKKVELRIGGSASR